MPHSSMIIMSAGVSRTLLLWSVARTGMMRFPPSSSLCLDEAYRVLVVRLIINRGQSLPGQRVESGY